MEDQKPRVLPKSAVAEAIDYALNQWIALTRFLEDGRLAIDNNEIEREMRAVALGRKNWMAAGSEVGGETAAIGFTMIASAAACGVEPVEWLTDVLDRIGSCLEGRLIELLPDRWKDALATQRARTPQTETSRDTCEASAVDLGVLTKSHPEEHAAPESTDGQPQATGETSQERSLGPIAARPDGPSSDETASAPPRQSWPDLTSTAHCATTSGAEPRTAMRAVGMSPSASGVAPPRRPRPPSPRPRHASPGEPLGCDRSDTNPPERAPP